MVKKKRDGMVKRILNSSVTVIIKMQLIAFTISVKYCSKLSKQNFSEHYCKKKQVSEYQKANNHSTSIALGSRKRYQCFII